MSGSVKYDNAGRVILVTGGASGIGLAICHAFHATGASVTCLDVAHEKPTSLPSDVSFVRGDTTSDEACAAAVQMVVERDGQIDVLVNNAAIQPAESYRPLHEYRRELWDRMVAVNMTGYANMARHVVPVMMQRREGVIVNLASAQGHRTARGVPAYGPVKAANIMQARQWGVEYARHGIRVVSISPGAIDTPMVRATLEAQGGAAELANRHPLGRIGHVDEVARAVLWVSSRDASFVTATDLAVDGGLGGLASFADPYPRSDT